MAQLYPRALRSLLVASYDSQGYSGNLEYGVHLYIMYLDSSLLCGEAVPNGDGYMHADSTRPHTEYRRIPLTF
jgi:hypothetical protein